MIARIWHGYTTPQNANIYEDLLRTEIFSGIAGRTINGYHGIQLLRRPVKDEEEFITIMWFDSIDNVIEFAGEDYQRCVVPAKAREVLKRFDEYSQHYEIKEKLEY